MSTQKFEKIFSTFAKGKMTEASKLNFPEDYDSNIESMGVGLVAPTISRRTRPVRSQEKESIPAGLLG